MTLELEEDKQRYLWAVTLKLEETIVLHLFTSAILHYLKSKAIVTKFNSRLLYYAVTILYKM